MSDDEFIIFERESSGRVTYNPEPTREAMSDEVTKEDLIRWRRYIGTTPIPALIDAYEKLLDERDRLREEIGCNKETTSQSETISHLRERNEKLEAVVVASDNLAVAVQDWIECPQMDDHDAADVHFESIRKALGKARDAIAAVEGE